MEEDTPARDDDEPSTSKGRQTCRSEDKDSDDDRSTTKRRHSSSESSASEFIQMAKRSGPHKDQKLDNKIRPSKNIKKRTDRRRQLTKVNKRGRRRVYRRTKHQAKINTLRKELSVNTLFTGRSSRSMSATSGCKVCGHRCCLRRCRFQRRLRACYRCRTCGKRIINRAILGTLWESVKKRLADVTYRVMKPWRSINYFGTGVQAGSRCVMLSPLCIGASTLRDPPPEGPPYAKISFNMIVASLKRLALWRQASTIDAIKDYMKNHYPVNPAAEALVQELTEKLKKAAKAGLVVEKQGLWLLAKNWEKRRFFEKPITTGDDDTDFLTPLPMRRAELLPREAKDSRQRGIKIAPSSMFI